MHELSEKEELLKPLANHSKYSKHFDESMCYMEGQVDKINIWKDPWIPDLPGFKPSPRNAVKIGNCAIPEKCCLVSGISPFLMNCLTCSQCMTYVEFFGQIMRRTIRSFGWETKIASSLLSLSFGLRIGVVKLKFCGRGNCGTTKFMKGKNSLFGRLLIEGSVSNSIWLGEKFPFLIKHVCMVVIAWKKKYTCFTLVTL